MPDVSGGLRPVRTPLARRAGAWLVWWVLLMSMWVILDDSIATDELLAGAGAAALGATMAELVAHQSGLRLRIRAEWLTPVVRLPAQVTRDTWIVFAALWRRVVHGVEPPSGFRAVPGRFPAAPTRPGPGASCGVAAERGAEQSGAGRGRGPEHHDHSSARPTGIRAVSSFVIAAAAMAVALVPCLVVLMRGDAMAAVVAYEAISSVTIMVLILLAEGFRRTGEFELPVLVAVLLLGSGLVFVRFLERGL